MISKLGVGTLLAVAMLFAAPSNVLAASSSANTTKIKKYFSQLKKLKTGATPASKVNSLVVKLTKLDPKKATKYYRVGLTKLTNVGGVAKTNANQIMAAVARTLKQSSTLSSTEKKKIAKQVQNEYLDFNPVSPTAMLATDLSLTLA